MREPRLWLSNRNGNVFTVSANERYMRQLTHTYQNGVRVKRLAASQWCAWAVGHDHRVYTYVIASDVPIRVPQTTYENQRWSPFNGFRSSNLLPTDRRSWSDEHGDGYLPKESIRLPSSHWDWEGDWFIDENLQGEICTDRGGWQYAMNFNAKWTSESCWNSCVRKRKWVRFCRFTATNTWSIVSDMEVVEKSECFIDIAVGGDLLPGQLPDFLSVWAITNSGQVYVRKGVCRDCPEGKEWVHIPCHSMGIINIACGPTGLVWATTWDGHAIVRTHVSRDAVYGLDWEFVPYPEESTRLMQVSVGRNSVWALSRAGQVWFRQGVNGDKLIWDAKAATGNGWVLMVGEMSHLAVSANDQVFAVGVEDEEVWFRAGVTPSEPGGKTWQRVLLEEHPDVYSLYTPGSLMSQASQPSLDSPDDIFSVSDSLSESQSVAMMEGLDVRKVAASVREPRSDSYAKIIRARTFPKVSVSSSLPGPMKSDSVLSEKHLKQDRAGVTGGRPDTLAVTDQPPTCAVSGKVNKVDFLTSSLRSDSMVDTPSPNKSRPRSSSWQVIENCIDPPTKHDARDPPSLEAHEVIPAIPLTAAATANLMQSTHSFDTSSSVDAEDHDLKLCGPSLSVTASDGAGEAARSPHKVQAVNGLPFEACTGAGGEDGLPPKSLTYDTASGTYDNTVGLNSMDASAFSDYMDSLDSGPSSDTICNFVTDLIDDEEEVKRNAGSEVQKGKTKPLANSVSDNETVSYQDLHDQNEVVTKSSASQAASIPWLSLGPSETFSGRASENATPSSEIEVVDAMVLTPAQPRYAWGWLSAADFVVENPVTVSWLSRSAGSDYSFHFHIPKVSRVLRDNILQLLKQRNQRVMNGFSAYEHAVEKTTWVKKAKMKMQSEGRGGSWLDCTVELEQGMQEAMDGTLTIQYTVKHKHKVIQTSLQDIRCINMRDDHRLAIYTRESASLIKPLILQATSEAEAREWLGTLNVANLSLWGLNQPISPGSIFSLTVPGHVFVHTTDTTRTNPAAMMWGQHGGHMAVIETTPCGVTWALSFDQTPWVYNGGYGGAVTGELSETACNLREQVDYRTISVFENQMWYPVVGYCSRGLLHNNFAWTTPRGKFLKSREDVKLPSSHWQWVSDWMVDFSTPGGVSNDGWQYAPNFHRPYHSHQGIRDRVRRRQWSRKCKLVTQGPWVSAGPPELIDITLQVDAPLSPDQPLVIWAIGANGDVLCRNEVTQAHPMGNSWIHVSTSLDMPLKSISVGGRYRVWAIAKDGSVWYRTGVSPHTPAGSCWIQVIPPPPGGAILHHISAGGTAVWAVDTTGNLWRREEITPTFPEGTRWAFVCNHVRRVSVGPKDQVWVVSDANFGRHKHNQGVLYRRLGINEETPSGNDWEPIIGPGWHYVSVRGLMGPRE
ncbi:hypothetical protein BaRGS_00000817 [Batillaria attramentaria]|uniref:Peroxin/Ferlin domain-containing protein n=1 Tax=Batillaria attramentaria TaxID=370345 RepID=A0ABD0M8Z5_9CAEN